jgi:hypothetical protein
MWPDSNAKAGGIDSGKVTGLPHRRKCSEFGISGQLPEWQIQNIRLVARLFGIEGEQLVEALGRGPRFDADLVPDIDAGLVDTGRGR